MPNVQVTRELVNSVRAAHAEWQAQLPRRPGQLSAEIVALIEGPAIYTPNEVTTYSDFEPICFYRVDPRFIEYLRNKRIPFDLK